MSKDLPFFKFYPAQWITGDIMMLKESLQGAFIRVCCIYWSKNCSITEAKLQRIVHKTKLKALQNEGIIDVKNGEVIIKFLDEQFEELAELQEKRRKAGQAGGKASVKQRLSKRRANVKHLEEEEDKEKNKEPKVWKDADGNTYETPFGNINRNRKS